MQIGVVFPQIEMPADRGAIRSYTEAVEQIGYRHLLAYDHVLGVDPSVHDGFAGFYTIADSFHEPMVLFGYLAAVSTLELVTGVLVLSQRDAVLVAKQAAEVDILTGGRFRLGVGIGWNGVECRSIGHSFDDRGRRLPEQVDVLRRLWHDPVVEFSGEHHELHGVGIKPYPVQRPIPVWFGATSEVAIRRAARLADGYICFAEPGPRLEATASLFWGAVDEAGRARSEVGLEGKIDYGDGNLDRLVREATHWSDAGATHLCVNTMKAGLDGVDGHIAAVGRVFEALRHLA